MEHERPRIDFEEEEQFNCISYVREGAAKDEWRTAYIPTGDNPLDLLTKALHSGQNRKRKVRFILYDIYPESDDKRVKE